MYLSKDSTDIKKVKQKWHLWIIVMDHVFLDSRGTYIHMKLNVAKIRTYQIMPTVYVIIRRYTGYIANM